MTKARIYKPSKSAMQSGRANLKAWVLEYEPETRREPESLMGWTASGDTTNQVRLRFSSAEEAVAYARDKGWDYAVDVAQARIVRPRNYVDNFRYIPPKDSATK